MNAAIEAGDVAAVAALIANGADLSAPISKYGNTALHLAAAAGALAIVEVLLSAGVAVDIATTSKETPLHKAAMAGHLTVVERLLAAGANTEHRDEYGRTALHKSVGKNQPSVVRSLLAHGAKLEARDKDGVTALFDAVNKGLTELVELLLAAGANLAASTKARESVFAYAVASGHCVLAEQLVDRGARMDLASPRVRDAVVRAISKGDLATLQYLAAKGADVARHRDVHSPDPAIAAFLNEQIARATRRLVPRIAPPASWTALARSRDRGCAFAEHFTILAETDTCRAILDALGAHVDAIEVSSSDDALVLVVRFDGGLHWSCHGASARRSLSFLPPSYRRVLEIHDGIEHVHPDYTWGNIWLSGVDADDDANTVFPRRLDVARELAVPIAQRSDRYVFHPTRKTSAGEPALGYVSHESDRISRVHSTRFGAGGHFLRLAGHEIMPGDERCDGFPD